MAPRDVGTRWLTGFGGGWPITTRRLAGRGYTLRRRLTAERLQHKHWLIGDVAAGVGDTKEVDWWHAVGPGQGIRVENPAQPLAT